MNNQLLELVKKRRSTRKYTGESVDRKEIEEILKIALLAPSSWGKHPVEFVVVDDKEMIKKIAKCKAMGAGPLPNAEYAIVVMVDRDNCELWIEDGAVASTYILLAAETLGLGACWIHIRDRAGQKLSAEEEIQELLGIPKKYGILNVVAIGQKGEQKPARSEKDMPPGNIHYGQY